MTDSAPEPNGQDRRNAAIRAVIAERQNAEFREVERLALDTLGPGWAPWMKLALLDADHHQTGNTTPRAVAYKVYKGEHRLSENSVYLRKFPDGAVQQAANYDELFPELHEQHPTRTLEVKGKTVAAPRWSLCWSALELYMPKSAEALAALRASRERKREERADKKWTADHPLLAWAEAVKADEERGRMS